MNINIDYSLRKMFLLVGIKTDIYVITEFVNKIIIRALGGGVQQLATAGGTPAEGNYF